jgi:hypothetical protein
VVYSNLETLLEAARQGKEPLAHGIASSPEEAMADAQQQVGPVELGKCCYARWYHQMVRAKARQQTAANGAGTAPIEFVYRYYQSYEYPYESHFTPYRIARKTKTRIYIESEPYRERTAPAFGDWHDYDRPRTFCLDRREFETTGKARGRGWGLPDTYYADPEIYYARSRPGDTGS